MLETCYLDTETCGLTAPAVIIQTQFGDGPIEIQHVWTRPAGETRALIQRAMGCRLVCHNLTFDAQVLHRTWAGLLDFADDEIPTAGRFAASEWNHRADTCLRPAAAICTLLLCQKQLGGTFLATKEVRIRQVPVAAAQATVAALNEQTHLPPILFARRRQESPWKICDSDHGNAWADIVLKFSPSNALKDIAALVLGVEHVQNFSEIQAPQFPFELPWCPYSYQIRRQGLVPTGLKTWEDVLPAHVAFWSEPDTKQRLYATEDIRILHKLYEYLGSPEFDEDGELAVQVASVRLAGFNLDLDKLSLQYAISDDVVMNRQVNVNAPKQVKAFIGEVLDPMELHVVAAGCDKNRLKNIIEVFDVHEECCDTGCPRCGGHGKLIPGQVPVVQRAKHILNVRKHTKRRELYTKLLSAEHAFPGFRVVGTKSGRMSGADGLNYHGIDGSPEIREIFTLTSPGQIVSGGDFDSQELAISSAVMQDTRLAEEMAKGKSLHAMFASELSGIPYDQIIREKEDKSTAASKIYTVAKTTVYAILYGAGAFTIAQNTGRTEEEAQKIIDSFFAMYADAKKTQDRIKQMLTCVKHDEEGMIQVMAPEQDYIESIFGYRRSFEVEMNIIQIIATAMKSVRAQLRDRKEHVVRRDKKGEQTLSGATLSAMYGAAFSTQGRIIRAGLNHLIQSAGRTCTLGVQYAIWDRCQPRGIGPFRILLMSIHDELATCTAPEVADEVRQAVCDKVADLRRTVPLLGLEWTADVGSWCGVKNPPHPGVKIGFTP